MLPSLIHDTPFSALKRTNDSTVGPPYLVDLESEFSSRRHDHGEQPLRVFQQGLEYGEGKRSRLSRPCLREADHVLALTTVAAAAAESPTVVPATQRPNRSRQGFESLVS